MAAKKAEGASVLPPLKVAKMAEIGRLIERMVTENTSVFSTRMREYREARAEGSERPLTAHEASQVASGMIEAAVAIGHEIGSDDLPAFVQRFQDSKLRAVDVVPQQEVLLAAGVSTAPMLIEAVAQLVALIEMPEDRFRDARESGSLPETIKQDAAAFDDLDLAEARARASTALEHFQKAAGATAGEVVGLLRDMLAQAMTQAAGMDASETSPFTSLTGSPPPMDGNGG